MVAGAALVPCLHFGENELYEQLSNEEGSWVRWAQNGLHRLLGFSMPIFYGNPLCPPLPKRRPVNTVIGTAIRVQKNAAPSEDEVDAVHAQYLKALSALFEHHKERLGLQHLVLEII